MRNNDLRKELQICDRISEEDLNQIIEHQSADIPLVQNCEAI